MKLLILTPFLPYPLDSGGNTRVFNLLRQLGLHGVQIIVGVITAELFDQTVVNHLKEFLPNITFLKLPYRVSRIRKALYFTANLFGLDRILCHRDTTRAILDIVAREGIDLIQVEFSQVARYLPSTPCPAILICHEFRSRVLQKEREFKKGACQKILAFFVEQIVGREELSHVRRYQTAICMSHTEAEWLKGRCPTRHVEVIENGVDLGAFSFKAIDGFPHGLYYIGWFTNRQNCIGLDFFLDAIWPLIRSQYPDFVVVGKDLDRERHTRLKREGISYLGFVETPELVRRVQGRLLLVPLRSGSGTRLKILEAMAMGNPVISTAIGIEGIRAEDRKHYVHAETADGFRRAIQDLMTQPNLAEKIAAQARALVEREYGWAALADKQIQVYDRIRNP